MTTAARAGQFTGATDNAAKGGLFTDSKIDGIPDLVAADVASAQTSATTATTQAATATTQATTATTKATEAATSATAAAGSATAAASSATAAAASATTASNATTSVSTNATNAATSETNAATSATNAAASASSASTQATNATTQANSALSSASAANTSATNAATSATTSTNYATKVNGAVTGTDFSSKAWSVGGTGVTDTAGRGAAKEWATEAEDNTVDGTNYSALHHAAKAAASATAAAASYDSFDDRYLGTKSSNPTVDNDGATLLDGALYFNTSDNVMLVYDLGNTTWVRTTPTTTNQGHINTVSGIQANVTTVAGISSEVSSVAAKASLITSDFVADLNTLGTSDIVSDLNQLATSDFVADLNAVEGVKANVTTVAGVASNVTTVAGVAANVTTVAGIASNVTTVAGANSNITTVASNISGVNSFADRYRVGSSDPGSSNDEGDLAYNSTSNLLKYYNGSAWVAVAANTKGIASGNVAEFGSGVADDDFLRINGTTVEGRSASEVLTDIGGTTATAATDEATALAIALG